MSSFVRRIQRAAKHKVLVFDEKAREWRRIVSPPRTTGRGWGSKLGVSNPRDPALIARRRRDAKWGRS